MNLLIGGTGFIGTPLSQALADRGKPVVSLNRSGKGTVAGVEYISHDLGGNTVPSSLLDQATNIFVLSGQIGPDFDPIRERHILEQLLKRLSTGTQRIFFCSTALVYGNCTVPANETTPCKPLGAYPRFKVAAEQLVRQYIPEFRRSILRLSNIYGTPKNRGFIGHAIQALLDTEPRPLTLNGNGQLARDYIFIDDVIRAMIRIMDSPNGTETINIATGTSHTLQAVVDELSIVGDKQLPYTVTSEMPDEATAVLISNQRFQQLYGPLPFTSLHDGLRQTLDRYR